MATGAEQRHARGMRVPATHTHRARVGLQQQKIDAQRRDCSFFVFLLKSAHAAPPPLVIDMRARNVLMMREVFDAWRHESFRHWPPAVTDLSILQDHLDVWHAWMQWVRLATGLGKANARRMGLMLRTILCEMLGCEWLGL